MNILRNAREWYKGIDFWLSENSINKKRAQFVKEFIPKGGVGAELGVFKGQFTPLLIKHTKAVKLHLIDPWYLLAGHWHWGGGDTSTVSGLIKVLRVWKKEIEVGRVVVHVGDDYEILRTFPDSYFDWVYIDSSHQYEHTLKELSVLHLKVKSQGIISGDDWQTQPSHKHHGVYLAVTEFCKSTRSELIYADETCRQWAIKNTLG
jgi:hypothetical protein